MKENNNNVIEQDNNGMDLYTHPIQPTAQFFFCGVPLRMDSYSGCSHGCLYCFARASEEFHSVRKAKGRILPTDTKVISKIFNKALSHSYESADIVVEWLRHRVPIHWGGMSDPFQQQYLHSHNYEITLY